VNVNALMFDFGFDVEAAGAVFPRAQDFYVSVDSARDIFTGERLPGRYTLRYWENDVKPPSLELLTKRVSSGRPTLAFRARDSGAGVDPLSLVIGYNRVLVGAAAYDPISGIALFPLPAQAPALFGSTAATLEASDYQETKNVNTTEENILPNTTFKSVRITAAARPAATWLLPDPSAGCVKGTTRLLVVASSPRRLVSTRFLDGKRRIATVRRNTAGLFVANWKAGKAKRGKHTLLAVVKDSGGKTATARRTVRVCR
jgi:hypothetical protein